MIVTSNTKAIDNLNRVKQVYEPQEDSYMLAECVRKYSYGRVIDIGTGSGVQGIEALKNNSVKSVLFSDINSNCINYVKNVVKGNRAEFIISDLFSNVDKNDKFDTIIFNPPYLPEDEFDKTIHNVGGKKGNEIILRFLRDAKTHLSENGIILFLFSSINNKRFIEKNIKLYYAYENVLEKHFFMEQLYVYRLFIKKTFKGHRGMVEISNCKYRGRDVVCAIKYSRTEFYDAQKEARFLKVLNKKDIGPKLFRFDKKNNRIIIEYIIGERIIDFIAGHDKSEIFDVIKKVLEQLIIMDRLGINKKELTNPYKHIIIEKKEDSKNNIVEKQHIAYYPVMIDFERCQYTKRSKNITQFIQFLNSGRIKHLFDKKNIRIDSQKMFSIAKKHHSNQEQKRYDPIKEIIECIN
ncbi:MAG: HemK2/MTQ2 family protein methyltransferase [Candidatus Woesearchaeota archaeon]